LAGAEPAPAVIRLRVHRLSPRRGGEVACLADLPVPLTCPGTIRHQLAFTAEPELIYAVLAEVGSGRVRFQDVRVELRPTPVD
jgi:hypothetical protein